MHNIRYGDLFDNRRGKALQAIDQRMRLSQIKDKAEVVGDIINFMDYEIITMNMKNRNALRSMTNANNSPQLGAKTSINREQRNNQSLNTAVAFSNYADHVNTVSPLA